MLWFLLGVALIAALMWHDVNLRPSPCRCVICRELTLNSGMICDACHKIAPRRDREKERTRADDSSSGSSADDTRSSAQHTSRKQTDARTAAHRILGVEPGASVAQIRRAYLRLMLRHHPDRFAHLGGAAQAAATRHAQSINLAYEQLMRRRSHETAS